MVWQSVLQSITRDGVYTAITSDAIGNTLSDGTRTYTWRNGRELATLTQDGRTWTHTYNSDGLRTKRTDGTTTYNYVYNGSQLSQMTVGNNTLQFTYDTEGRPIFVTYNGTTYYYITSIGGDVERIIDMNTETVVSYSYDPWGKVLSIGGTMADTLGVYNPLLYRGYVYDHETGLYYLQSRYYNPEIRRFINADGAISGVKGNVLGYNQFAYCFNNPSNLFDPSGNWPEWLVVTANIVGASAAPLTTLGYFLISNKNLKYNTNVDSNLSTTTKNKIINDQNRDTGKNFEYGLYDAEWNACGAIAVHNAKVIEGIESSLSETMRTYQSVGGMVGYGFFGSNPYAVGLVLRKEGIPYSQVGIDEMTNPGTYIITFWNENAPWGGAHTVAVRYNGVVYTAYNYYGDGTKKRIYPSDFKDSYICGVYLR